MAPLSVVEGPHVFLVSYFLSRRATWVAVVMASPMSSKTVMITSFSDLEEVGSSTVLIPEIGLFLRPFGREERVPLRRTKDHRRRHQRARRGPQDPRPPRAPLREPPPIARARDPDEHAA